MRDVGGGPPAAAVARIVRSANANVAMAAARRQHEAVEVTSQETPTRKVTAQPDGTMRAELAAEPMQIKRGDSWVPVDPGLAFTADRAVRPRAVTTGTTLSGGGDAEPLLTYGPIAVTWPGRLPAPVLDGATATYREVLPGVDLTMTASANSVTQHIVVKSAAAARNPALSRIRLGIKASGLKLSVHGGALVARDAAGKVVYDTPPAVMWDATKKRTAPVRLELGKTSLTLVPDRKLLTDRAAVFPMTIDPDWHTFDRSDWAKVFSGKPGNKYFYGGVDTEQDGTNWAKVGRCDFAYCNGIGVARTYWQFDTSFLDGKSVRTITFDITSVYSPSCNAADNELWIANRTFDQNLSWNSQPGSTFVNRQSIPAVYDGCAGYKGVSFNIGGYYSPSSWSAYYIKAADEGFDTAWRKYDPASARIRVNYNTRPNAPTELSTEPGLKVCKWCAGKAYVSDDFIRLKGRLTDPDGADQLTAHWDVTGGATEHHDGPALPQGNIFSTDVDLRNRNGQTVGWTVNGSDGWDTGPGQAGASFVVDRTPVTVPPNITPGLYQADDRWHGGVGVPGTFTFDSAGVADIDHFVYGWSDPPTTPVDADALGGKATVTLTPPGDNPRTLYVRSVDRAGNLSSSATLHFYVRPGSGPLAQYSFEGNAQDSAYLGDRDGTTTGGTSFAPGAVGSALTLDGTGYATTSNTVRTDISFSVSAWAKIVPGAGAQAIVSQDGTTFAGFDLWYRAENGGRWVFAMADPNATQGAADLVWSSATAQTNTWTQLTGLYDAPANQLRLYVNGELAGKVTKTVPPENSTGPVRIGRTMWDSHPDVDFLHGAVDEVKIYDRVLGDAEIQSAVNRDNVQVGNWKFDDGGGTTAENAVPGGGKAVLQGGAHFVANGAVNGAVQLDNPNDLVRTDGPVVRTDQSFSVAVWARLDQAPPDSNGISTLLAQDGDVNSAFVLGYRNDPGGARWEFYTFGADTATRNTDSAVHSASVAKVGEWTHLAAVYDAAAGKIRIYVNGVLAGTTVHNGGFNALGPLIVGRNKDNGQVGNWWKGAVDEVRAYNRVLSEDEIRGIVGGDSVALVKWKFDGSVVDSSPRGVTANAVNGVTYTAGQSSMPTSSDLAVRLDAAAQSGVSAPHVVDADRGFSVAAWAKADKAKVTQTVVSEDGNTVSGFKLQARDDGTWAFTMPSADSASAKWDTASGGSVQVGQWAHLVAVYDGSAHQIQLYVNGVLAATAAHTQSWNPSGGLQVGRAKGNGGPLEYYTGAVDDVSVYGRALFVAEIQTMSGRDLTLAHEYQFDESSGVNAADAVGARAGTLVGGAAFTAGRVGNAVATAKPGDAVTTTGVDIRTDQAFTVSAWVQLARSCDLAAQPEGCQYDAVSIDGARTSKFRLGHVKDGGDNQLGVWIFEMPESDTDGAPVTQAAVSVRSSDVGAGAWTHLVGVYDPAARKIWLYVDGTRVGDGTVLNGWQPKAPYGGLAVGRGRVAGAAAEFWPGSVDDVRLYSGVLDKDRVSALFDSYAAAQGSATMPKADRAQWRFDDNGGTIAADSSSRGLNAALKGTTSWIGGRDGPAAVRLDGRSGYAEAPGPVVDTTRSFSVAGWVYLLAADSNNQAVIAQDGSRLSAFSLGYNGATKRWMALAPVVDADNPGQQVAILNSTETAVAGQWTHLAMAYDADLHQLRLYVNGMLSGVQVGTTIVPAGGPMSVGRARWNGAASAFLDGVVDEVRVYGKALGDGEVRRVHDDVVDADLGYYRFDDGTARDSSWRGYDATTTGGVTFGPVAGGQAMQLDGSTGYATTPSGLPMRDSFTVSAWARLTRADRVATVMSQDGDRMSGYALQYRPELNRWVFGAASSDADGSPLVYAMSVQPPRLNEWTHLTGVYDYPARQLRLYVDGQLVGTRAGAVLWPAGGKVVIGRGRANGVSGEFFPGGIDGVRIGEGVATEPTIAQRGRWATPQGGQLGRFVNTAGDHYTGRTDVVRPGYHFEGTLGRLAASGPDTREIYACQAGTDAFTSTDSTCEGKTKMADIGLVYTVQPTNIPTIPVYECDAGVDRFESRMSDCEGATPQSLLGYTVAYGTLVRYVDPGIDHFTTVDGSPASYYTESAAGLVGLTSPAGTQPLMSCRDGQDLFASTDAACEGRTVVNVVGTLWPTAPSAPNRPIYRCRAGRESFVSVDSGCEGAVVDRQLGYVLTDVPATTAVFGS
ncbi:LamG domain-containing protein [Actinoplanes sp. NPDC051343]|uniref:LamG domain-containing protein n=1 Tax=Actinoplanes sp. NPDC051343 TaxID=3363906 RepID=UPI0037BD1CC7